MYAIPWLLISSLSYALCSFVTSGSYFKLHYGKDTSEESLKPEHFQCDRDNSCTHLAKVKGGKILTVNGKKELEKINDVVCIWEKVSLPKETSTAPAVSACSSVFALGMEKEDLSNGVQKIPNGNIQASSQNSFYEAKEARLNGMIFWRPNEKLNSYLQVYFGKEILLHEVATQGSDPHWTKDYHLSYSNDGTNFAFVTSGTTSSRKLFVGNTDGDTAVKNSLPTPVAMKYVRIYPVSYHGNIALRVEFYGCFK